MGRVYHHTAHAGLVDPLEPRADPSPTEMFTQGVAAAGGWSRLEWEHAPGIGAPFSSDAARYVRTLAARSDRHVDPQQAVPDLLADWARVR